MLNPIRWWALQKTRAELIRVQIKHRELVTAPGETTALSMDRMNRYFERIRALRAEIRKLEGNK